MLQLIMQRILYNGPVNRTSTDHVYIVNFVILTLLTTVEKLQYS